MKRKAQCPACGSDNHFGATAVTVICIECGVSLRVGRDEFKGVKRVWLTEVKRRSKTREFVEAEDALNELND